MQTCNFEGVLRFSSSLGLVSCDDPLIQGGHGGNVVEGIFWWEDGI